MISVVVPVLDEEARLARVLGDLAREGLGDVMVVDGGSGDRTVEIARAAGARVVEAHRGRARQMNAGARVARGDVLLFLHADTRLPEGVVGRIEAALADGAVAAGAFRTRTVNDGPPSWVDPVLRLADLRASYTRLPYGDQAIFARRSAFDAVGGFPEQPLFEDLELSRRLWTVGRVTVLPDEVRISGRRFVRRPVASTLIMNVFPVLYGLGVRPEVLARWVSLVR